MSIHVHNESMKKTAFMSIWKRHEPFIKAVVELFSPFVEVAVHDLEEGKIVALYNVLSRRKVGDASPLQELRVPTKDFPDYFAPYYKQNWDGRSLKCTSITLRDEKGKPVGLICLNADVSFFEEGMNLFQRFLTIQKEADNPVEMFGESFEKKASTLIRQYLDERQLTVSGMKREQKRELVQSLYTRGLFNYKNAAVFVAKKLRLSRASIYNHIKSM